MTSPTDLASTELALASLFPAATRDAWASLVQNVLKGADFDRKLVSRTYDGLRIEPLYPKAEGAVPLARAAHAPWRIAQRLDHPDPDAANALALEDLENGADALNLVLSGSPAARGFGLRVNGVDDLDRALSGAMLDLIAIRLDAGPAAPQAAAMLLDLADRRGHKVAELDLDLALDPIGSAAATGRMPEAWESAAPRLAEAHASYRSRGFAGRTLVLDGRPYHEAGASEAQELSAILATGLAYLRALEAGGHDLDDARSALAFLAVADADQFLTVAKLRALRRLWARVEEACGLAPKPIRLHAETAWRMTTRRDPWVNILRGTLAAFSAGIGGADSVTVLPFTAPLGLPDSFARRIARNTQLILTEEANLWRVADPVAGSGGFEALTESLAESAWAAFQELEREGGIAASLQAGALQRRIADTRTRRDAAIATRREPLTGTSEFPDIREMPVSVLIPAPVVGPADASGPASEDALPIEPLPSHRLAEPFEHLRDLSDHRLADTGTRPKVFLANLGPIAAFSARATFAKNFFEAGGIEAVTNDGFPSHAAMAEAFRNSGAHLACLCSSDEIYAAEGVSAASALNQAGAGAIYLAGKPAELADALEAAGVTGFIAVGSNVLSLLREAQAAA
jgi:methylmalonyl-CoA mutase